MLDNDNFDAAIPSSKAFNDNRVHHYYDINKIVGKTIADSVGWNGDVAWDIYLFYEPTAMWLESPPKPNHWMHQLSDTRFSRENFRTGGDLKKELSSSMEKLLSV